ncbi:MAG: hypothetical protein KDA44_14640 [Planctomycetales bacterium]|nr:hypothetical protein [Planctomycetales bacterium]
MSQCLDQPCWPRRRPSNGCLWVVLRVVLVVGILALDGRKSMAQTTAPVLLDNMDSGQTSLTLLNAGATIRILKQDTNGAARFGRGAERVVLAVPAGESAQVAYRVPAAPVIDELQLTAWVRVSRPGARLAAVIVLPNSKVAGGQESKRLLVYGEDQSQSSEWRRLTLSNLGPALERQSRIARASASGRGSDIDERDAYVEAVVVLCPGGPGVTELLVDQVAMYGVLRDSLSVGSAAGDKISRDSAAGNPPQPRTDKLPPLPPVPQAPRIVQWQGESFAAIKELGFDAALLARLPTDGELHEARRAGVYLVCPPPGVESGVTIGPQFDIVLAWDFGLASPVPDELARVQQWAGWLQRHDPQHERRTVIRPGMQVRESSRLTDALVLDRPTLGSSQSLSAYSTWFLDQRRIARPGTPIWSLADTHYAGRAGAQLAALRASRPPVVPSTYAELFRWSAATFPARPEAFCFRSEASLTGADRGNRLRAAALELLNLRLGLVEPWLAHGTQMSTALCSRDDVTAIVLQIERSHLIVPMMWDGPRMANPVTVEHPLAMKLPGVPESAEAYLLTGVSAQRLRSQRVAGGLRITVETLPADALILLTEDGQAFTQVETYLRRHARRAVDLRALMVELKRQQAAEALALLPQPLVAAGEVQGALHRVAALTQATQGAAAAGDFNAAYEAAAEADALLDELEHRTVERIAISPELAVSPLPLRWETAPDHVRLAAALARGAQPWQALPGGEFEDLSELLRLGWRHLEQPLDGVASAVRLSPEAAHRGQFCLELDARATRPDGVAPATPAVPVWVTSPPISLPANSLLEISGVVRTSQPLLGPDEALLAFDSLGGEQLALRFQRIPSWQPLRMMRLTGAGGETRLTLALDGIGRVQIDSLAYRITPLGAAAVGEPVRLQARQAGPLRR